MPKSAAADISYINNAYPDAPREYGGINGGMNSA
jgi:hypothetical protein